MLLAINTIIGSACALKEFVINDVILVAKFGEVFDQYEHAR
jgi:hypothetical protein